MRAILSIAMSAVMLLAAGSAAAQDDEMSGDVIESQLGEWYDTLSEDGLDYGVFKYMDALNQGGKARVSFAYYGGTTRVVGVCDEDCDDLDLIVTDANGREVARDDEEDSQPIVAIPETPGTYTIEVQMVTCSNAPCVFGLQEFSN